MACAGYEVGLDRALYTPAYAENTSCRSYVTLKIFIKVASMGQQLDGELKMYQRVNRASKHPGRKSVRSLLDSFRIDGPEDKHQCLVHPPLFESVWEFLHRNPVQRLPKPVLAFTLRQVFLALDYLHTECQIIHAGIRQPDTLCACWLLTWIRHQRE